MGAAFRRGSGCPAPRPLHCTGNAGAARQSGVASGLPGPPLWASPRGGCPVGVAVGVRVALVSWTICSLTVVGTTPLRRGIPAFQIDLNRAPSQSSCVWPHRAVKPVTDNLIDQNHSVRAERKMGELVCAPRRRPRFVQGGGERAVLAVVQRQVNGVPATDEDFDAAGHHISVGLIMVEVRSPRRSDDDSCNASCFGAEPSTSMRMTPRLDSPWTGRLRVGTRRDGRAWGDGSSGRRSCPTGRRPRGIDLGAMREFGEPLERDLVVATWNQRCAGISYDSLDPTSTDRRPVQRAEVCPGRQAC